MIESDGPGGAESVVLALSAGLRERALTVRPVVFGGGEGWLSGRLRGAGHNVFLPSISRTRPVDLALLWRLTCWVRSEAIDILHAHEMTMAVYASAVGLITRTPHIITMHGGSYYASAPRRVRAMRWSARRAVAIVGVAESTCEQLSSTLALPRSQIALVPNGVAQCRGDREKGRTSLGVAPHETLLLAVGNLYAVKGHTTLVAAAQSLKQNASLPPWKIAIAGRGDEENALRYQIAEAGLGEEVQLLGLRSDIPDLLAAADGWVMPSRSEGLPMALLEAMMAGVPTICSAVGGIPTLVEPGVSGWLVEPMNTPALAKALTDLLRHPQEARVIGERGRVVAQAHYGLGTMIDRYINLYRACL